MIGHCCNLYRLNKIPPNCQEILLNCVLLEFMRLPLVEITGILFTWFGPFLSHLFSTVFCLILADCLSFMSRKEKLRTMLIRSIVTYECFCDCFVLCCSPYSGAILGSEKSLSFPNPTLPTGEIPSGFLGFAVNMINIDTSHLSSVTSSGLGLRETLFYRLFGELQVYKTRVEMERAVSVLKADAISLDGGIVSRKGILSLGHW